MRRREFIGLLGGAAAVWPIAARAQQAERMRRIGVLTGFIETDPQSHIRIGALLRGLEELGWVNNANLKINFFFAGSDPQRVRSGASELMALVPELILVQSTPGLLAVRQVAKNIPTVFVQVADTDLAEAGITGTLARPGGNITGFTNYQASMGNKWLQVLKEVAPALKRVAVILHPETRSQIEYLHSAEEGSSALDITVTPAPARDQLEIERAISDFAREPNGGLIALPHNMTATYRKLIADLAFRNRLPAIGAFRYMVDSGCLISYGIDVADLFRRSAVYIDRILRGTKPADLPIQQPTKYEMVINLKTAKTLGLTVPPTLFALADEVIE
jgi:ABC-type uncharacterized transport system substrate-binding protein